MRIRTLFNQTKQDRMRIRMLFNQTKQDRMRFFEEILFSKATYNFCIIRSFEKEDFLENLHSVFFCLIKRKVVGGFEKEDFFEKSRLVFFCLIKRRSFEPVLCFGIFFFKRRLSTQFLIAPPPSPRKHRETFLGYFDLSSKLVLAERRLYRQQLLLPWKQLRRY